MNIYESALQILGNDKSARIDLHTYYETDDELGIIYVRIRGVINQIIAKINTNGSIFVNVKTKKASIRGVINRLLPFNYTIMAQDGFWFWYHNKEIVSLYTDNDYIDSEGFLHCQRNNDDTNKIINWRNKVSDYSEFLAKIQFNKSISTTCYCWDCSILIDKQANILGDSNKSKHVLRHLFRKEKEPALVIAAIRKAPNVCKLYNILAGLEQDDQGLYKAEIVSHIKKFILERYPTPVDVTAIDDDD